MFNNQNEANPYLRQMERIEKARQKWNESEWLLNLLRTQSDQPPKLLNDEEVLQWAQNLH
jgi:hypothetical protein